MFFSFPISLIFSTSCLLVLFFRIFAKARTHGQMLTVGSRLFKTYSRHVTDWNESVARTGHATLFSGGEPTRVKRDPSGRVELL